MRASPSGGTDVRRGAQAQISLPSLAPLDQAQWVSASKGAQWHSPIRVSSSAQVRVTRVEKVSPRAKGEDCSTLSNLVSIPGSPPPHKWPWRLKGLMICCYRADGGGVQAHLVAVPCHGATARQQTPEERQRGSHLSGSTHLAAAGGPEP